MEALVQVPTMGGIVLIDERKPDLSYRLLQQRARKRKKVLCITREPPERVARRYAIPSAEHYWLITGDGGQSVSPFELPRIRELVREFLAGNPDGTILIDGVELLMVMNTYEAVRDFLADLHETLQRSRVDGIVPIDTRTLTTQEFRELRSAFTVVRGE